MARQMHTAENRMKRIFCVALPTLFAVATSCRVDAQSELNCAIPGAAVGRPACMASVFLDQAAAVLEVLRLPDPGPVETAAELQAYLTEILFRLRNKQRLYREACGAVREAVRGSIDSSATLSADLLCEAFAAVAAIDSSLAEKFRADFTRTQELSIAEIAVAADKDVLALERGYASSRIMMLAVVGLSHELVEPASGKTMRLAMTQGERKALLRQMDAVYPVLSQDGKKAQYVLEQTVDLLRELLLQDWSVRSR